MDIRIDVSTLKRITDVNQERNIYVHSNPIARDIFWQRIEKLFNYITEYTGNDALVLDFGGGSGVFAKSLCTFFNRVELVDLDTVCAEKIKNEFRLNNLKIISSDIRSFTPLQKYDLVIAADVLEHFKDLTVPLEFIHSNLKKDGLLMVSLPTENRLYEIGRKMIRKKKPVDHFHSSSNVIEFISSRGFKLLEKAYIPRYLVPVPLFEIVVFIKFPTRKR